MSQDSLCAPCGAPPASSREPSQSHWCTDLRCKICLTGLPRYKYLPAGYTRPVILVRKGGAYENVGSHSIILTDNRWLRPDGAARWARYSCRVEGHGAGRLQRLAKPLRLSAAHSSPRGPVHCLHWPSRRPGDESADWTGGTERHVCRRCDRSAQSKVTLPFPGFCRGERRGRRCPDGASL